MYHVQIFNVFSIIYILTVITVFVKNLFIKKLILHCIKYNNCIKYDNDFTQYEFYLIQFALDTSISKIRSCISDRSI